METSASLHVLTTCAAMERTMAATYQRLAAAHRRIDVMYRLWTKTGREEENHARQFDLAAAHDTDIGRVLVTAEQADQLLATVRRVFEEVEAHPPEVIEALTMCIDLEEQLADFHMASMTAFARPAIQKLFEAMMKADRGHVEALRQQLQAWQGRTP